MHELEFREVEMFTPGELSLLSSLPDGPWPVGGQKLRGTSKSGSGSAGQWTYLFNPTFQARYGVTFVAGSFNIQIDAPARWIEPLKVELGHRPWEFCPVIIADRAVGVAFRGNRECPSFLEIASPVHIRERLGCEDHEVSLSVALLPGSAFADAIGDG